MLAIAIAAIATWITANQLSEAYGSGPSYYGHTTNMDKWESPLPFLFVLDGIALVIVILLARVARRSQRASKSNPSA